ncbi:Coenzyme F420 hydrogenase/dehydrogenase, beta subunit C-terminal domain [bacterium]|nr:Coenzyme F420 hydrogenase/dehydrogenase, beta subunit C-terminal domain [bacterium]
MYSCTGCGACVNICRQNALTMKENNEGFKYPSIDENKCTKCGSCNNVCPITTPKYTNNKNPKCIAFMASDKIRAGSTSGGVFTVLAYEFIKQGGFVSGAVFNSDYTVSHIVSNLPDDIEKMRKSKYLQSDTCNCMNDIKKLLEDNKKVLFSGTPCQIAGLKAFLSKEYNNLYCLDLICHGVPSYKVFKKYIDEEIKSDSSEKWITTDFRDKTQGWNAQYSAITTKTDKKEVRNKSSEDDYIKIFLSNSALRKSCEDCKFAKFPRQGDLTIGDFWRIEKYNKDFNDEKGTSVVLINNEKGKELSGILERNAKLYKPVPLKYAVKGNPNLTNSSIFHKNRNIFFKNLDKKTLKANKEFLLDEKCDCMIINYWFSCNYGASLTCFGTQCLMESLGYSTKIINYTPAWSKKLQYKNSFSEAFANKYLNLTNKCTCYEDFINLNAKCNTFITGSDQVFAPYIMRQFDEFTGGNIYLLGFADSNKRKLSYAASTGVFDLFKQRDDSIMFRHYLGQFDKISVREDNGQNIVKSFGVNSEVLIDGAFHIPHHILDKMTENYKNDTDYIAFFALPYFSLNKEIKIAKDISEKLGLPLKIMMFDRKISVEEWLGFIKNAKFVLSNSYHAIVFSIIFNVPFAQLINNSAQDRFETLFKKLNIEDNSIDMNKELDYNKIFRKLDWENINSNIEKEVLYARNWMKQAMEATIKDKSEYEMQNYLVEKTLLNEDLKLYINRKSIYIKYYSYKLLSKLMFGKKRKLYKEKRSQYKIYVNKIRSMK